MLLQHPVALNRNEQIKTMNNWGVIFLHPHITMRLEHTPISARLVCRCQTGKNCGVKLMSKKKSPAVPMLKLFQARSNSPEIPTFSVTLLVGLMIIILQCSFFFFFVSNVYKWKLALVKSSQKPITCQNHCLLIPYPVSSCCCFPVVFRVFTANRLSFIQRSIFMNKMTE